MRLVVKVEPTGLAEERSLLTALNNGKYSLPLPFDGWYLDLEDAVTVTFLSRQEGEDVGVSCTVVGRRFPAGCKTASSVVLRATESERAKLRVLLGRYR